MPLPTLLIVAREPDRALVESLRTAGFPTMVVDDVRGVPNAVALRAPDILVIDLPSFKPSCESAFESVLATAGAPIVVLDDDEERLLELLRRGAQDGQIMDANEVWRTDLPGLVRRAQLKARGESLKHTGFADPRALLDSLPGAVLALGGDGVVRASNRAARRILNIEDPDTGFGTDPYFRKLGISGDLQRRLALSGSLRVETEARQRRIEVQVVRVDPALWPPEVQYTCTLREESEAEAGLQIALEQERANRLVEYAGDILLMHDTEGRIVDANRQATQQLGYTREELLNLRIWDLDPQARPGAGIWARLSEGGAITVQAAATRKDGSVFPTEVRLGAWEHGGRKVIVAFIRDISERRKAEEEQRLARAVFDAVAEGIMVTDTTNRIVAVNPAFTALTGYTAEEVIGQRSSVLKSGQHPQEFYEAMWLKILEDGLWEGEIWNRKKDGTIYPEWLSITTTKARDGKVERYVGVFTNISERKQAEEMIRHQAHHDALTGLPNRALFLQRLAEAIKTANEEHRHVALLFIDLDKFKAVNDTMGHEAGDLLLKLVSQRLTHCSRRTDTVARLGGDEFTVILPSVEAAENVREVPVRILKALERPFDLGGQEANISGSIGVTFYPEDANTLEELLRYADRAMYKAKVSRNAIHRFTREDLED